MTDATPSALFLREAEIRRGVELLFFGYSAMSRGADALLASHSLGRPHQRALYFIARQPGLTVTQLLRLLAITKQSLSRVLGELQAKNLVVQAVGDRDRRQRLLRLTVAGAEFERALFEKLRAPMAEAYAQAGQQAVGGFWAVLSGLVPPQDRAMVRELQNSLG